MPDHHAHRDLYARSWRLQSEGRPTDDVLAEVTEHLVPFFATMPGYLGGTLLVDRDRGALLATTFWDSLEHLEAAQGRAESSAAATQILMQAGDVEMHVCDVLLSEPPPAHLGSHLYRG